MSLNTENISDLLAAYAQADSWLVGYSGGLDSTVLLHLLVSMDTPTLRAIHINHGLSPNAGEWQSHCERQCAALGVSLITRAVRVETDGRGTEAAARDARYQVFSNEIGNWGCLLLAHHQDDQVETMFLRLMRGAGLEGLSGMPFSRSLAQGRLVRPLLGYSRHQLQEYAEKHELTWIEDESNEDLSLDRNYLRRTVLPMLESRWPGYRGNVHNATENLKEAADTLQELLQPELAARMSSDAGMQVLRLSLDGGESELYRRQLLRVWLRELGEQPPERRVLEEFFRQLSQANPDTTPELRTAGYTLRFYRGFVYLCVDSQQRTLLLEPCVGEGIRADIAEDLEIVERRGGERCRPAGRAQSQTLKKLLQDTQLPPWLRQSLPIVVRNDGEIVAVADLWVCEGYLAAAGEAGLKPVWR